MRIPIFTDDPGWHGEQLKTAFAKRDVEAEYVSLRDCSLHITNNQAQVYIPVFDIRGFDNTPPAAFVRGVSGGTLQQVIMRLNILHMLQNQGVMIYNQAKAIERTVDKAMTSFLLQTNQVPTPATWACESREQAEQVRQAAVSKGMELVLKPLFGSQGVGVRKLVDEPLPVPMQQHVEGVYYLQQYIETPQEPHDYRVFVINGKVVAAMRRLGTSWVNNIAAGARCEAVIADEAMTAMAINAAKAVDIDYCGVDIIQSVTGTYYVLEVNSIPAWKGLQSVAEVDIAQLLVDDFLEKLAISKLDVRKLGD